MLEIRVILFCYSDNLSSFLFHKIETLEAFLSAGFSLLMCLYVCGSACACLWRPEDNNEYRPLEACLSSRQGFSLSYKFTSQGRLAGQIAPTTYIPVSSFTVLRSHLRLFLVWERFCLLWLGYACVLRLCVSVCLDTHLTSYSLRMV